MSASVRLLISNGDTTVDLSAGALICVDWSPSNYAPKDGGLWRDNPLADGRRIIMRKLENGIDTFAIRVMARSSDRVATTMQHLKYALNFAVRYWLEPHNSSLSAFWIEARGDRETESRYAVIHSYRVGNEGNPNPGSIFNRPVNCRYGYEFDLVIEHGPWLSEAPGSSSCVEMNAMTEDFYPSTTWAVSTAVPADLVYKMLEMPTGRLLAACKDGVIYYTDDGTVWNAGVPGLCADVYSLTLCSDGYVYAGGISTVGAAITVWRSQDGANWLATGAPAAGIDYPNTITAAPNGYLFGTRQGAAVSDGVYRSIDQGATWVLQERGDAYSVIALSDGTVLASFDPSITGRSVMRSTDYGATWTTVISAYTVFISSFAEINGVVYAGGNNQVAVSNDMGLTWSYPGLIPGLAGNVYSVILADDGLFYAVTSDIAGSTGRVIRSPDLATWETVYTAGDSLQSLVQYSYNGRFYAGEDGDILVSPLTYDMGAEDTCLSETFLTNHFKSLNISHVLYYDASGAAFTSLFPLALPYTMLPAVPTVNDYICFAIDSALTATGDPSFMSIVFDIGTTMEDDAGPADFATVWEYTQGAGVWAALTVTDNTMSGSEAFAIPGVNSVAFLPPSLWAPDTLNGVTALWVRMRISAHVGGGVITPPTQQNRYIYTVSWPYLTIASDSVGGDFDAVAQLRLKCQGDADGVGGATPDLYANQLILATRSLSRGADFSAYLNVSDEQNAPGMTATPGGALAFGNDYLAPTYRSITWATAAVATATIVDITLQTLIARQYYGRFHVYGRVKASIADQFTASLRVYGGSGNEYIEKTAKLVDTTNTYHVIDWGEIVLPLSAAIGPSDVSDQTILRVIANHLRAVADTFVLFDLILMPVDEWSGHFIDRAVTSSSALRSDTYFDLDSVGLPRNDRRSLLRQNASGNIQAEWQPIQNGPFVLDAEGGQRIWSFAIRESAANQYVADPAFLVSAQLTAVKRYWSMRGDA